MQQNGKRGRQDGQMAVDDRAKIAKRGASGPSPPTHIRVRALHRPQGALRPLLDATAVDGKASNKAVVQPRARLLANLLAQAHILLANRLLATASSPLPRSQPPLLA